MKSTFFVRRTFFVRSFPTEHVRSYVFVSHSYVYETYEYRTVNVRLFSLAYEYKEPYEYFNRTIFVCYCTLYYEHNHHIIRTSYPKSGVRLRVVCAIWKEYECVDSKLCIFVELFEVFHYELCWRVCGVAL